MENVLYVVVGPPGPQGEMGATGPPGPPADLSILSKYIPPELTFHSENRDMSFGEARVEQFWSEQPILWSGGDSKSCAIWGRVLPPFKLTSLLEINLSVEDLTPESGTLQNTAATGEPYLQFWQMFITVSYQDDGKPRTVLASLCALENSRPAERINTGKSKLIDDHIVNYNWNCQQHSLQLLYNHAADLRNFSTSYLGNDPKSTHYNPSDFPEIPQPSVVQPSFVSCQSSELPAGTYPSIFVVSGKDASICLSRRIKSLEIILK